MAKGNCLGWATRDASGDVGEDDVSLRITHCGVCHADVVYTRNKLGDSIYPVVPGHEIVGIVKEVGSHVHGFKVGDRVGVGAYLDSCRECEYCNERLEVFCSKGALYTINGVDVDGSVTKGGYSSFIVVHEGTA
uniref:Alcohol dehydrogenase-like N-terminal domain-containing protein n=1 Tax=Vitis vinifera TaxID=29760 RepID=F6I1X6_VITVI